MDGILPFDLGDGNNIPIKLVPRKPEDIKRSQEEKLQQEAMRNKTSSTKEKPKATSSPKPDRSKPNVSQTEIGKKTAQKDVKAVRAKTVQAESMSNEKSSGSENRPFSLLSRYNDVPDYPADAYHPKDFDYHRPGSCGKRGTGTIDESFKENGIECDFESYKVYSSDNPAPDDIKKNLTASRRKACNCEVERKLTNEHMRIHQPNQLEDQAEHVFPMKKAASYCKRCAQIERDILHFGYLKHETDIENNDAVIALMMALHDLRQQGESRWKDHPGITAMDKLLDYMWNDYLPRQPLLKNLRKNMTFLEFSRSLGAVDIFLQEKKLQKRLHKASRKKSSKLTTYDTARRKVQLLSKKKKLLKDLVSLRRKSVTLSRKIKTRRRA